MSDRELLELAAKAAGKTKARYVEVWNAMADPAEDGDGFDYLTYWNPIADNGDAFRLMVGLRLPIRDGLNGTVETGNERSGRPIWELWGDDPLAATRRAIVRAAAEIGKGMK